MAENVREWVADWYRADYYQTGSNRNPKGPAQGQYRVVRGGSYMESERGQEVTYRSTGSGGLEPQFFYTGFRCAQ